MDTLCEPIARETDDTSGAPTVQAEAFRPPPVEEWSETGLPVTLLESLVLKCLFTGGEQSGRTVAQVLCMSPKPVMAVLQSLKNDQLAYYKDSAAMGDFTYALTENGRQRARALMEESMYVGAVPVPLDYYIESVKSQTISHEKPGVQEVRNAFSDILLSEDMLARLGPAINSARGLFIYGAPGNGKTAISERITRCFRSDIWIPKAVFVDGRDYQVLRPAES